MASDRDSSGGLLVGALRALRAIAVVVLIVAAATARVVVSGEREFGQSTAALREGDVHRATEHARRSAGFYAPGAPHVGAAYTRLFAIAAAAEGHGDREAALYALRAVRIASIETRWIFTPHAGDRERADQAIAKLMTSAPRPPGTRVEPPAKIERAHVEALARDEAPRVPWIIALLAGAIAWAAGGLWAVRRAVLENGAVAWARARPAIALGAAGMAVYLAAIWRA